ncbi:EAL domain-containing protein [Chitiniphilus purpureus]|uniref:EAL domain-containing protein n=1 Tax=Chitiniphilus purpureus TaxID=2981137 RepID=A0ABY6DQ25_9NEIS|nr:EAL domain-containing protein [Chitiniphilus sp. CD1]UXY15186.1 EAL domain-containing protein [Chitiniphilus sp. CD1]
MPERAMQDRFFLGRQPIINRQQQLVAYELLFRSGQSGNAALVTDDLAASAAVISHAFTDLGLISALEGKSAFINVDAALLFSEAIELLPRDRVVLELLETVELNEALYARCRQLRQLGYRLALDDVVALSGAHLPLLPLVDVIKVDVLALPGKALAPLVHALRAHPVQLLAEKVGTPQLQQQCSKLGFDLFQGYYFARPTILSGRRIPSTQAQLLSLLNMVQGNAEISDVEAALKRAPDLALGLLKLVNSVACGLPVRITSVRHAITLLGMRQLQRWLQILMFSRQDQQGGGELLLHTAIGRGRFMERLAQTLAPGEAALADSAFLTGLLSLLDALLGRPLAELLPELNLSLPVQAALLGANPPSRLGKWLALTLAVEAQDLPAVQAWLHDEPSLSWDALNRLQVEALHWADEVGRDMG